jgi:capsular polysaccharide biosynthesis protein
MIINMAEVESLILSYGFEALDPAELSVVDQMAVFQDAEYIISPVGAALANAIFTPAGCKVIALAPYYENANYYYYSNLMGVLGHDLHYVLGTQVEMDGHVLHRNYSIDLDALKEALERLAK